MFAYKCLLFLVLECLIGDQTITATQKHEVEAEDKRQIQNNIYVRDKRENEKVLENIRSARAALFRTKNDDYDPCAPYNPPRPNFFKPGRRISEVKCYEHLWNIKNKEEIEQRRRECNGKKFYHITVVSGRLTEAGEFPHMAAVGWKAAEGTWIFKCGGSLISPKFVLTAGHCIKASPRDTSLADPVPKLVRLGDKNILDKSGGGNYPTDINISRIISHPLYRSPRKYNDIALFELAKNVEFSLEISSACLWPYNDLSKLSPKATVTGWGVIKSGASTTSPELRAAEVNLIDSRTCDYLLRTSYNRLWRGLSDTQMCAGTLAGGADTCQGDSGGPLQVKIPLPREIDTAAHYILGVTSFGIKCGFANSPGIYTRVSSYLDWIESVVWPNNNQ